MFSTPSKYSPPKRYNSAFFFLVSSYKVRDALARGRGKESNVSVVVVVLALSAAWYCCKRESSRSCCCSLSTEASESSSPPPCFCSRFRATFSAFASLRASRAACFSISTFLPFFFPMVAKQDNVLWTEIRCVSVRQKRFDFLGSLHFLSEGQTECSVASHISRSSHYRSQSTSARITNHIFHRSKRGPTYLCF